MELATRGHYVPPADAHGSSTEPKKAFGVVEVACTFLLLLGVSMGAAHVLRSGQSTPQPAGRPAPGPAPLVLKLPPPRGQRGGFHGQAFDAACAKGRGAVLSSCRGFRKCLEATVGYDERAFRASHYYALRNAKQHKWPRCTKDTCLNRTRCRPPFRAFVYSRANAPASVRACLARDAPFTREGRGLLTSDPTAACIFWLELAPGSTEAREGCNMSAFKALPAWELGLNHVFFDLSDAGFSLRARNHLAGRAALAQARSTVDVFVHGLDVSVARPGRSYATALAGIPPWSRKYLLTFKGEMAHTLVARLSQFHGVAPDVVVAARPPHSACHALRRGNRTDALAARVRPCCASMGAVHDAFDDADLRNTTFALVPPGEVPGTDRLAEALSAGAIPVFVGMEEAVLPFNDILRWHEAAVLAPAEVDVAGVLVPHLREMAADRDRVEGMQRLAKRIFKDNFEGADGAKVRPKAPGCSRLIPRARAL